VVVDAVTRTRHASNRELVAQGLANLASAAVGGVPGAGTSGATLVNIASGAETRRSGVIEGALVGVAYLALGGLVAWAPIAALAGILVVVAYRMVDWGSLRLLRQRSTLLDFGVVARRSSASWRAACSSGPPTTSSRSSRPISSSDAS
jgi:SulP family sulfate permease